MCEVCEELKDFQLNPAYEYKLEDDAEDVSRRARDERRNAYRDELPIEDDSPASLHFVIKGLQCKEAEICIEGA